jgi:hypothetical protein
MFERYALCGAVVGQAVLQEVRRAGTHSTFEIRIKSSIVFLIFLFTVVKLITLQLDVEFMQMRGRVMEDLRKVGDISLGLVRFDFSGQNPDDMGSDIVSAREVWRFCAQPP